MSSSHPAPLRLFGTDGIRAKTFEFPLTLDFLERLGPAFKRILNPKKTSCVILFARDTRASGKAIFEALSRGFASSGFNVWDLGVLPTPSLSYLVRSWATSLGCVISASHNPPEFNGVKFFDSRGQKIPEGWERKIERILQEKSDTSDKGEKSDKGQRPVAQKYKEAFERYRDFLFSTAPTDLNLKGFRVALDCGQGATYKILPDVFRRLGAQVVAIGCSPNGKNINCRSGAMDPKSLSLAVKRYRADVGFALDGDGDRLVVTNETGEVISGEQILATVALDRKERRESGSSILVTTTMSNLALKAYLRARGITTRETSVGDRWVLEALVASGSGFGGENSGHFIWPHVLKSADGSLSSLILSELIRRKGVAASKAFVDFPLLPQAIRQIPVASGKPDLRNLPLFQQKLREIENTLDSQGRVFVRYSGTEPVLRILLEGKLSPVKLKSMAQSLIKAYVKDTEV